VLPQVSLQKSLDSPKYALDLKKTTRFDFFAAKCAVLLEMMWLFSLSHQNIYTMYQFAKTDHAETWKIS